MGSKNRRTAVQAGTSIKARPYSKNNKCKRSRGCDFRTKAPAQQMQGLEFKPQY
jgi:hypothetical protein